MMCDCHCHSEFEVVYACVDCPCKAEPITTPSQYDCYNNCGNCTHNILQRLWRWKNHRVRTSRKTDSRKGLA